MKNAKIEKKKSENSNERKRLENVGNEPKKKV